MQIIYELVINKLIPSHIKSLNTMLENLSKLDEIKLLSEKTDNISFLIASFSFPKWQILALKKYKDEELDERDSEKSINTEDIKVNVKNKIIEASRSEVIASNLIINVEADQRKVMFRSKYIKIKNSNQIAQVGIYLQQKLELLFHKLQIKEKFSPIKILEA